MRARELYEEGESVYNKTEESYWLHCPKCGTRLQKMLRRTVAYDLPLYCRQCKVEVILNIGEERVRAEQPVPTSRGELMPELNSQCQS